VGAGVDGGKTPEVVFKHILFPADFGTGCTREAAFAFSIGQEHDATLTLLHVVRHLEHCSEDGLTLKRKSVKRQLRDLVPSGPGARRTFAWPPEILPGRFYTLWKKPRRI